MGSEEQEGSRTRIHLHEPLPPVREPKESHEEKTGEPELSWFLTLVLLTVVTVVSSFPTMLRPDRLRIFPVARSSQC